MHNYRPTPRLSSLAACAFFAGCAAAPPVPFQIIDDKAVAYTGTYQTSNQQMDIRIAGQSFHGFYIVASGTNVSITQSASARRFRSYETVTNVSSNSARALLTASGGERITCNFLFEDRRAVGDCKSSTGRHYQFIATGD